MRKQVPVVVALCALLTACADMADGVSQLAGIGVIEEEKSTFDNATIVKMSPAFLYRGEGMGTGMNTKLGARWSSKSPDDVALILAYSSNISTGAAYLNFAGMDVNIDGVISEHKTGGATMHDSGSYNTVSRTIYTESKNAVVIPLSTLQKMVTAKDTRLRIHTSRGYEDAVFSIERIPGGQGTAILHFRQFLTRVQEAKAKGK